MNGTGNKQLNCSIMSMNKCLGQVEMAKFRAKIELGNDIGNSDAILFAIKVKRLLV